MPADASIYQQFLQPPKSVMDYQAQYDQADARKNALQQSVLALQKGQMDMANAADVSRQRNALRDAVTSGQIDLSNPDHAPRALAIAPDVAPAMLKTVQEGATSRAKAGLDNAQAGKTTQETQIAGHAQHLQALSTVNDPQAAVQWITDGVRSGALPAAGLQQALDRLQQASATPDGFAQWKQQTQAMGLTVQQQMEQTTAKPTEVRLGNVVKTIDMNPRSQTFGKEVVAQQPIGLSPDTASTNAAHIQGINIQQAGENKRSANTIAAENLRAGASPDGSVTPDMEVTAQAIAKGQLMPPTGAALLNPKNSRVLARVMEINPDYDATTVTAKRAAATAFTSGSQGNAMRSFAVAGQHLDQLGQLVDGLDNRNFQIVNKIGNAYATQTGNPAPTNFDAAKDVVSKEVVKAIVAGGGGVAEREELSKLMDQAKSPAQLKGVIAQYRNLMAAQHDALLQQRDAAGLPRSTLPNYKEPGGGGVAGTALPPDIANILQKHGGK